MGASFVWRMDDITPTMNWNVFNRYIELFQRYHVKPLLGVVPDNKDPVLDYGEANQDFWKILRQLKNEGIVEISQHGYQHVYVTKKCGIFTEKFGFFPQSEFAGLSYEEQFAKIKAGQQILRRENLETDVWMAPNHSFDEVTVQVLADSGFKAITDGIALYPYVMNGMLFIPHQYWVIRMKEFMPFGIITFGMHINYEGEKRFPAVEKLLQNVHSISFSEARKIQGRIYHEWLNSFFKNYYYPAFMNIRKIKRHFLC